ncbi:uncharacterized protein LOC129759885 [Uranotaenia lowii]|uniref:uncharacterized protein LOC129759885 n=1 Tax=Uranotaenia lowii TaxID=190385 RepID=UPI0024786EEF|nr:uncharacterized protein LOC129759885 [Uranotaenia lowii]
MDPRQFQQLMEHQTHMFTQLFKSVTSTNQETRTNVPVPQPSPLSLEGDMEANFEFFERNWLNYVQATGMNSWPEGDNARKVSLLLSVIGEEAKKKYFNFELTNEESVNPDAALAAIKQKVIVKRNIIVDRLDFFSAFQLPTESTDQFSSRLRLLARVARLAPLENDLVTYKMVTANKWSHLRTKMLTITDITLEKAIDLCRAEEIAAKRATELGMPHIQGEVNKVRNSKASPKKLPRCKFCGGEHKFAKGVCPAFGQKCYKCKGKNHFEQVCKRKRRDHKPRKIKEIQKDSETEPSSPETNMSSDESEEFEIGKVYDNSSSGGCVLAELELKFDNKWKLVMCEVDTGANTSLIGYNSLVELCGVRNPPLLSSKFRLQSFGGNPIKVLGQVKVPCRRSGRKFRLVLQVVDVDHRPLLSAKVSRVLGLVKFCNTITFPGPSTGADDIYEIYKVEARKIVEEYHELFEGYGKLPGTVHLEIDNSVTPTIQPPRRVPLAVREKLKVELEDLEKNDIIVRENNHTDWVSNIVVVKRGGPDSGVRICLDPVLLNKALKRPNLQFVTLDEILPELGKARVFSTVDARKGFWHIELDSPSSKLTTFWTPFGRYRWKRLPFGIASAPELFQIKLQEVIQGLDGVECIADDLLIYGAGDTLEQALENHNRHLRDLFMRLKKFNIKLNKSKLKLCERSIKFYGHVLTDHGLKPDETKIEAIRSFPTPTNRKAVHRFVGMVTYLGRFMPNLSASLSNLRKLILESTPWQWTSVEEKESKEIKTAVSKISTLQYYNINQPVTIECDASCIGLGVAVFQDNGVVGYASRTLTPAEKNYAQIEKELLAILFACVRFDQLIVGNPRVIVRTDHKPLLNVFQKPLLSAPRRLQHMLLNLQRYNLTLEFVTGKNNVIADALSRAPIPGSIEEDRYEKRNIFRRN